MVNLMTVVADGAGRWDTGIPLHMAIDTALAHLFRTHTRSLPFSRLGFLLVPPFAARFCSSYTLGGFCVWRFTFFFSQHRRFRSTRLIFISFPISGI